MESDRIKSYKLPGSNEDSGYQSLTAADPSNTLHSKTDDDKADEGKAEAAAASSHGSDDHYASPSDEPSSGVTVSLGSI